MGRLPHEQIETWVETYLRQECTKLRSLCVKNKGIAGWPDRTIYWWDGVTDLVETKRPRGGRFEPKQLPTHAKLRRMGHNVFVINTREQVDAYIALRREHGKAVGVRVERDDDD